MDVKTNTMSRPRKHRRRLRRTATLSWGNVNVDLDSRLLRFMWLTGLCFLATSVVATYIFSSVLQRVSNAEPETGKGAASKPYDVPTVTIFTAPAPFEGIVGKQQRMAIDSWLRLEPTPAVVLLGQHFSLYDFAATRSPLITVKEDIDLTFTGKPFFHTMISKALASSTAITMLVDPDVILLGPVIKALLSVQETAQDWLVAALPRFVSIFPFGLEEMGFKSFGIDVADVEVENFVKHYGVWNSCDGAPFWAWNGNQKPLHAGVMPPFVYRHGQHNEWLLSEAISSNYRTVLDASQAFYVIRTQVPRNASWDHQFISSLSRVEDSDQAWRMGNAWLSERYGSFHFRLYSFSDISLKLLSCDSHRYEKFCLMNTAECPFFSSPLSSLGIRETETLSSSNARNKTRRDSAGWKQYWEQTPPWLEAQDTANNVHGPFLSWLVRSLGLGMKETVGMDCTNEPALFHQQARCTDQTAVLSVPSEVDELVQSASLESLVKKVTTDNNVVILAVVGNSYRDMLMSWVCRLKHLGIYNFVVSAIEDEVFRFATLQGLPVFRTTLDLNISRNDCHFGSHCFTRVTKMKSRTVLQILRLGYHVLFSDVDVYWFKDPTEELMSYGPGHLPAQTDQWNETEVLNEPRRLNSGFYFAWADNVTIAAFERIVAHGISSNKSEQPSFYDTLCGSEGEYAVGSDLCVQPDLNMTVHFLDPLRYPNGAYRLMWTKENVRSACLDQDCVVLHNNWIPGRQNKMRRQIEKGLWDYDSTRRMCIRPKE